MSETTKNIVTIGGGVAAWCLNWQLSRNSEYKVTNISSNNFLAPCSTATTSTVGQRGTKRGVSELGEKILDSQILFDEFLKAYQPNGISYGDEFHLWPDSRIEKYKRRYPERFDTQEHDFLNSLVKTHYNYMQNQVTFIDSNKLKNWFLDNTNNVKYITDFVQNIETDDQAGGVRLKTLNRKDEFIFADKVIVCASHATSSLLKGRNKEFDYYLDHSKPVTGSFLEIDLEKTEFEFDRSINLKIEDIQFIYRKEEGVLQLAATSDNMSRSMCANNQKLNRIYNVLAENLRLELPPLNDFRKIAGIRHKGFRRLPFWGQVDKDIYSICGLYKNAFTFSFLAADEIAKELC